MSPIGKKTKIIQKVKYIICFYYYVCHHHHHHHHHLYNIIFLKHCLEQALLFRYILMNLYLKIPQIIAIQNPNVRNPGHVIIHQMTPEVICQMRLRSRQTQQWCLQTSALFPMIRQKLQVERIRVSFQIASSFLSSIKTSIKPSYVCICSKCHLRNFLVTKIIVKTDFCINFYFGEINVSEV